MEGVGRFDRVGGQAQQMGHRRLHEPGLGGDVRIGPVQLLAKQIVIGRDMVVFEPLRCAKRQPMRRGVRCGSLAIGRPNARVTDDMRRRRDLP
ncbi:hypothetical protein [Mesorhizobium sp. AR07]|uniref:hypothetical protein n=1 Tax=Mesorhizobium sp. AR07 TaxID=2865838 RepID=UPI00215FD3D2|nr:hypothetical protein [Mesorhizobium sp. AR07]